MNYDFSQYITQQKNEPFGGERGGDQYAYSIDLKLLRTMRTLKPIELAVSSTVVPLVRRSGRHSGYCVQI